MQYPQGFLLVTAARGVGRVCQPSADLSSAVCRFGRSVLTAAVLVAAAGGAARAGALPSAADSLVVGRIEFVSEDIFTRQEVEKASGLTRALRRAMNLLHVQTREWVVRHELLFASGDRIDPARLAETERNLRQLGVLADVEVVPVDTTAQGQVTVRVSYRDSWSLRSGVSFAVASDGTLRGNVSLTERNFLGQAVVVQGLLGRDADATYGRLYFRQNRFLRSTLALELNLEQRSFGYDRWLRLGFPFRNDDQTWSCQVMAWTEEKKNRWYLSHAAVPGVDPADEASLYALIPRTSRGFEAQAARRVSPAAAGRIWRLGAGVRYDDRGYHLGRGLFELSSDDVVDLGGLAAAGSPLARASGPVTWPHVSLATHGRTWVEGRYLLNYGSREDVPLDAQLELQSGPMLPDRGWQTKGVLSDWSRIGPAFTYVQAYGEIAQGGREPRPALAGLLGGVLLRHDDSGRPPLTRVVGEVARGWRRTGDAVLVLGLDRGLRTLGLDGMAGDTLVRWNVEHGRPLPIVLLDIFQTGWGAFYDGGLARFAGEDRGLADARHEVGVGLRFGSLRSSSADLARLDLSWDLAGGGLAVTTVARGFF